MSLLVFVTYGDLVRTKVLILPGEPFFQRPTREPCLSGGVLLFLALRACRDYAASYHARKIPAPEKPAEDDALPCSPL